jgi:hypothetical protein
MLDEMQSDYKKIALKGVRQPLVIWLKIFSHRSRKPPNPYPHHLHSSTMARVRTTNDLGRALEPRS